MPRECRFEGCSEEVLACMRSERLCFQHFSELVLQRTSEVRARLVGGQPVDSAAIDWLLGDAAHIVHALTGTSVANNENLLELLLCLANLQDYVAHHSFPVRNQRR